MILEYEFGEYEPDDDKLEEFIINEFAETYGIFYDIAKEIIDDNDLYYQLQEDLKDEILNHFEDDARDYIGDIYECLEEVWHDYE